MTSAGSRTKTGKLIDVIFVAKGVAIVVGEILIQDIKIVIGATAIINLVCLRRHQGIEFFPLILGFSFLHSP